MVIRVHKHEGRRGSDVTLKRADSHAHSQWNRQVSEHNAKPPERPKFGDMWAHHQAILNPPRPSIGGGNAVEGMLSVGGEVADRINTGLYKDLCALRMSAALNRSGGSGSIDAFLARHPRKWETPRDADGKRHLARVAELGRFLRQRLGGADMVIHDPSPEDLRNFKGIVLFQWEPNKGQPAMGHADLWNGEEFSQHGEEYLRTLHEDGRVYGTAPGKNVRVLLWSLPI
jgi:hypothetical protein